MRTAVSRCIHAGVLLLAVVRTAEAAPCGVPSSRASLAMDLRRAELAYANLDAATFEKASSAVGEALPCLGEPIDPALAANIHRVFGLRAWLAEDADLTRLSFAAARRADPDYAFPDSLIGAEDPERGEYVHVPLGAVRTEHVRAPKRGELRFDGTSTLDRPTTIPTIIQIVDEHGGPRQTAYLLPAAPMPGGEPRRSPAPLLAGLGSLALLGAGAGIYFYNLDFRDDLITCGDACDNYRSFPTFDEGKQADDESYTGAGIGIGLMVAGGVGLGTAGVLGIAGSW